MQVVKATKTFRQVSLLGSMLMAIISISILIIWPNAHCDGTQLRGAVGIVFTVWTLIFVLLLLQVIGLVKCLKKIPKVMFGFYCSISSAMWFVQMLLFSSPPPNGAICRDAKTDTNVSSPLLYYYLLVNVIIFYLVVAFGLATWGSYLCAVADIKEEVTKAAIDEYLAENQMRQKHFMITAGTTQPLMLEAQPRNDLEAAQRSVMAAQYAQKPQLAITVSAQPQFKDYDTTNYNSQSRGN